MTAPTRPEPDAEDGDADALRQALQQLLTPLAELAVARGLPCAPVEAWLQHAFVQAALRAHPEVPPHRAVSRVSTVTGLHRRRVAQCLHPPAAAVQQRRSPGSALRLRWITDRTYHDARGRPRRLPRSGPAPSFETLAASVTRDVHPRSLLDEMVRLGLVRWDEAADRVALTTDRRPFAPAADDERRLLGFLGDNVGDHLAAAVANVAAGGGVHPERAVFADGLSEASLQEARALVQAQWQQMVQALVPRLQQLIDRDAADADVPSDRRLRVGLYAYHAPAETAADAATRAPAAAGPAPRSGGTRGRRGPGASAGRPSQPDTPSPSEAAPDPAPSVPRSNLARGRSR